MNAKTGHKPMPLGRGLSALFGDADAAFQPRAGGTVSAAAPVSETGPRMIPIGWIQPGAFQPRRYFDEEALAELAASIRERGIIQPLVVRPIDGEKDSFEIVAGERRWRAAQIAGIHEVPVVVRRFTDRETTEIGLIENVQRQDLSPLEEAEGYRRLIEDFGYAQPELAKTIGKSRPHISNFLRLLTLPDAVKEMLADGRLSMGHARTLVTARDPESLAKEVVAKGLSVRQTEALMRKAVTEVGSLSKTTSINTGRDPNLVALEKRLENNLGLRTRIMAKKGKGSLVFSFDSLDQLDGLLTRMFGAML